MKPTTLLAALLALLALDIALVSRRLIVRWVAWLALLLLTGMMLFRCQLELVAQVIRH